MPMAIMAHSQREIQMGECLPLKSVELGLDVVHEITCTIRVLWTQLPTMTGTFVTYYAKSKVFT